MKTVCMIGILTIAAITLSGNGEPLRLNQAQVIGTHNSYHIAPNPSLAQLIDQRRPGASEGLAYTHRPIREQLDLLGVRQLELDIYADPEGGKYAEPMGRDWASDAGLPAVPEHDPEGILLQPGFKILHVVDIDFQTTVLTLREALLEILDWSQENSLHFPILILIEAKEDAIDPRGTQPTIFSEEILAALNNEILETVPRENLLTPADVQKDHATLRDAVANEGWPTIDACRGRLMFALDNENHLRDLYAEKWGAKGPLFLSVDAEHPLAAWMKINDPVKNYDKIRTAVESGFLVRTRADAGTSEARAHLVKRRNQAFQSGAQFISTDYPEPALTLSHYQVQFDAEVKVRPNPITAPRTFDISADLEDLWHIAEPNKHLLHNLNSEATRFHSRRRLGEASERYQHLLNLDPPETLSNAERRLAALLAPVLLTNPEEHFALRDIVAVIHPDKPLIGYHLFWEDDIDFPEDNDPVDHEVVWVRYDPETQVPTELITYFHSSILRRAAYGQLAVGIEWGKHGSLPLDRNGRLAEEPSELRTHWMRLHTEGTRLKHHPLARGWPKKFDGDYASFLKFTDQIEQNLLRLPDAMIAKTRWANAVIDQQFLPYNFSAKTEWPPQILSSADR